MRRIRPFTVAAIIVPALLIGVIMSAPPAATAEPAPITTDAASVRFVEPTASATTTANTCASEPARALSPPIGPIPNATDDTTLVQLISRTRPCFALLPAAIESKPAP